MKKISPVQLAVKSVNTLATVAPGLAGLIAFKMFGKPKKKVVKPSEMHFLATGDFTTETLHDRQYGVWHWGFKGPVALLVHGWESHSGRWRKMVPLLLNAGYQVIAVDAPAHGKSDGSRFTMVEYADIIRFLLKKHQPVELVIGHSVGATSVVWALSTTGPGIRPKKAVLLAPFSSLRYTMERSAKSLRISKKVMDETIRRIEEFAQMPFDEIDISKRAHLLQDMDALILHDKEDKVTEYTESVKLQTAWPKATLVVTQGFGHGLTAPEIYGMVGDYVKQGH